MVSLNLLARGPNLRYWKRTIDSWLRPQGTLKKSRRLLFKPRNSSTCRHQRHPTTALGSLEFVALPTLRVSKVLEKHFHLCLGLLCAGRPTTPCQISRLNGPSHTTSDLQEFRSHCVSSKTEQPSCFGRMAKQGLSMLSYLGSDVRAFLMGIATGTRGENVIYHKSGEATRVALTIDDAPSKSADHFCQLLDLLAELRVHVSFQVISDFVKRSDEHLALMKRAVAEGHHLTNHSTKDAACTSLSAEEFRARLKECAAVVDDLQTPTTEGRRWFRPPCGLMNGVMRQVCIEEGYTVCLGDCYSDDCGIGDVDYHVTTLLRGAVGGSIIIVHCPEGGRRAQTLEVLPQLVAGLRQRGLEPVSLTEMFSS